jgi:hypothetical protein
MMDNPIGTVARGLMATSTEELNQCFAELRQKAAALTPEDRDALAYIFREFYFGAEHAIGGDPSRHEMRMLQATAARAGHVNSQKITEVYGQVGKASGGR